jgi:transcriptional regulator with XRE-family HTH domain
VYISRIENGRVKTLKTEIARKLAVFFHVSLEYLLTGEEGKKWDASEIDWSLQDFLKLFLSLSPEQQAQVMAFTGFISGRGVEVDEQEKERKIS